MVMQKIAWRLRTWDLGPDFQGTILALSLTSHVTWLQTAPLRVSKSSSAKWGVIIPCPIRVPVRIWHTRPIVTAPKMGVILDAVLNIQPSLPPSLLDLSHTSSDPSSPEDRSPRVAVFPRGRSQVKLGWRQRGSAERGSAEPSRVDPTPTRECPPGRVNSRMCLVSYNSQSTFACSLRCTLMNEASPPSTEGPGWLGHPVP